MNTHPFSIRPQFSNDTKCVMRHFFAVLLLMMYSLSCTAEDDSFFKPMKYTLAGRDERALIKMLVDPKSDKVIAAHMIGPDAPEIIQGVAIAIKNGLTKAQFDSTVAIHPSSAEEFVLMTNKRE